MLYGIGNTLYSLKPNFSKIPENYLNIDNVDEDNTLFDNETAPVISEDINNKINENEEKDFERTVSVQMYQPHMKRKTKNDNETYNRW